MNHQQIASIILAAGRGSRMKGFEGNKTLLPLIPDQSPFKGRRPILMHILENIPPGPHAIIIHHRKDEVIQATAGLDLVYCEQESLNGTGGALLAALDFIKNLSCERFIITLGDAPFIKPATFLELADKLDKNLFVVLGFIPVDRKQYGLLEVRDDQVLKIIEPKYWQAYDPLRLNRLRICNGGIYAGRREVLLDYLPKLQQRPHLIQKERNGKMIEFEEYFLTDLVEWMNQDKLKVGLVITKDETEAMGLDDLEALVFAQKLFTGMYNTH